MKSNKDRLSSLISIPNAREVILSLVSYDRETGEFTRISSPSSKPVAGKIAGCHHGNSHIKIEILGYKVLAHRLAWWLEYGEIGDGMQIDHINGNAQDNRLANLRLCTKKNNLRNTKLSSANSSGYKGVTYDKQTSMWKASIQVDGRSLNLGRYRDPALAAKVYDESAKKHFGEFAKTNEMLGLL